jgi:hypothetical protein
MSGWPERRAHELNPATRRLRPRIALDPDRCERARQMRRKDPDLTVAQIAASLGPDVTEADVRQALATIRLRHDQPRRRCLNVLPETARLLEAEARKGEPIYRLMERIMDELAQLRARVAASETASRRRAG